MPDDKIIHLNPPPTLPEPTPLDNQETLLDILGNSCSVRDVTKVIINQINGLQQDIFELDEMKILLKNIFPKDAKSYRNSYVIENKVKTFTGFHTTILACKKV